MTTPRYTVEEQTARVFAWRHGFNATFLIDLGIKLGLFRALADTPGLSAEELAGRLGLKPRHVGVWCRTAYAFEMLEAAGDGCFTLAPFMDQVLATPGHPRYVGGYVQLGTDAAVEDFLLCRAAFRSGENRPFQGRPESFPRLVSEATNGLQYMSARKVLPEIAAVKAALGAGGRLLEVGCGTARHLLQIAKSFPAATCVGVDIDPTSIAIAERNAAAADFGERVRVVAGTIDDAAVHGPYDAVVMVEVLHEIAADIRQDVISACARALRPGGWLVIIDETYPGTLAELRDPAFQFAVQTAFEELVWGNDIPTREEQERLLATAGFGTPVHRETFAEHFTILRAQRP
ncbi:MAG: methyltransferase domain-containing protein [Gammaproteobacteria bacterium]|nr:methyltransferase domain-containing protein [Gammaproteobacteria bacterium]MBI5615078.1 methyltransferase domain-containing protein [Gammaproteobacteria bacterium]